MVLLILVVILLSQVELSQVRAPFFVHDTAKKPDRGESARLEVGAATQAGAQATQAAVQAGAQATQAAVQAGAASTTAAAHAGTLGVVGAGGVALIVGIFLGIAIRSGR